MATPNNDIECLRAQVVAQAIELFEGNQPLAETWLSKPLPAISNAIPNDFINSPERAKQMLDIIGRLEHGVWT